MHPVSLVCSEPMATLEFMLILLVRYRKCIVSAICIDDRLAASHRQTNNSATRESLLNVES